VIVRILGEGQFDVPDSALGELETLDTALQGACDGGENEAFRVALAALLDRVRELGEPVAEDYLGPSELVLPAAEASLNEVRELLTEEGLIHG
jgi:PspAA-like protein